MREVEWIASSLVDRKKFPGEVQKDISVTLRGVQHGDFPHSVKALKGLSGVHEIRSSFMTDTYRTVYVTKIGAKIYVLHSFQKKSTSGISTPKPDMDVIKTRLNAAHARAKEEDR